MSMNFGKHMQALRSSLLFWGLPHAWRWSGAGTMIWDSFSGVYTLNPMVLKPITKE